MMERVLMLELLSENNNDSRPSVFAQEPKIWSFSSGKPSAAWTS